jgi:hypothetical protein
MRLKAKWDYTRDARRFAKATQNVEGKTQNGAPEK